MAREKANKPVSEIREGSVRIAIWENNSVKGAFYSATIQNSYKDEDGWHETSAYGDFDLEALSLAALEARKKMRELRRQLPEAEAANG